MEYLKNIDKYREDQYLPYICLTNKNNKYNHIWNSSYTGSGKTLSAIIPSIILIEDGYRTIYIAENEKLALQVLNEYKKWTSFSNILLYKNANNKMDFDTINDYDIIISTHGDICNILSMFTMYGMKLLVILDDVQSYYLNTFKTFDKLLYLRYVEKMENYEVNYVKHLNIHEIRYLYEDLKKYYAFDIIENKYILDTNYEKLRNYVDKQYYVSLLLQSNDNKDIVNNILNIIPSSNCTMFINSILTNKKYDHINKSYLYSLLDYINAEKHDTEIELTDFNQLLALDFNSLLKLTNDKLVCPICRKVFNNIDKLIIYGDCGHAIHAECYITFMNTYKSTNFNTNNHCTNICQTCNKHINLFNNIIMIDDNNKKNNTVEYVNLSVIKNIINSILTKNSYFISVYNNAIYDWVINNFNINKDNLTINNIEGLNLDSITDYLIIDDADKKYTKTEIMQKTNRVFRISREKNINLTHITI